MIDLHEKRSIKALWGGAVIWQAIEDHVTWREIQSGRKKKPPDKVTVAFRSASAWIEGGGPDFIEVCNMAGVNPDAVQKAAGRQTLKQIKAPVKTAAEQLKKSKPKRHRGRPRFKKTV